jgi:hypothetical protein
MEYKILGKNISNLAKLYHRCISYGCLEQSKCEDILCSFPLQHHRRFIWFSRLSSVSYLLIYYGNDDGVFLDALDVKSIEGTVLEEGDYSIVLFRQKNTFFYFLISNLYRFYIIYYICCNWISLSVLKIFF